MVEYAQAECATCHAIRPKNEMREVAVERVTSRRTGQSSNQRHGTRHSSSFGSNQSFRIGNSNSNSSGSRSSSGKTTRIERVFVCDECKAPKSDGWFGALLVKLGIVAVVIYLGFVALTGHSTDSSRTVGDAAGQPQTAPQAQRTSRLEDSIPAETPVAPRKPKVVFAAPKEVVQGTTTSADNNYPPCSATVTDHCIGN